MTVQSNDGINYVPLGTGSCITSYLTSNDYYVFLRVTATCGNNTTATSYIGFPLDFGNGLQGNNSESSLLQSKTPKTLLGEEVLISPNPSSEKVQISVNTKDSNPLTVLIQDLTGKTLRSMTNANLGKGVIQFDFDVKEYPNGIYLVLIKSENKTISRKLIIQK